MENSQIKRQSSAEILAHRILALVHENELEVGSHIKEMEYAKLLKVSRTPIRGAFSYLQQEGFLTKKPNQGYFLAKNLDGQVAKSMENQQIESTDLSPISYQIGQDYLSGRLARSFTENELINRYDQSRKSIQEALLAMEKDGWLTRNLGYGWEFNEFISSPTAYAQSYRFRLLIEPEALREPGFQVNQTKLQMLRMSQIDILNNDEKLVSAADMFNAGVLFHETIVAMSGNVFLLDALKRVNRLRRLIEYNVNGKRPIPRKECEEHLLLLELIENNQLEQAAEFLSKHLGRTAGEKEQIAQELFGK
ncbi:GntR family transcriptional regulator [Vibrio maritimus]|uniref:GntR family transcriptional regulator n=1 Tax=Vibrio maritimus TaxID=990268 RepID=UPI001F4651ED|nr:GntR family transcriptional regulator [Vibrio maritimus]